MEDETNTATVNLNEALSKIKSEIDILKDRMAATGFERAQILDLYRRNVLPYLLDLRRLNRVSKDKLEIKHDKVKQLNQRLDHLHDSWSNIVFETSCLKYDVVQAKKRLSPSKVRPDLTNGTPVEYPTNKCGANATFDADQVALLDHRTRLSVLDEEESKRKSLQDKLADITTETSEIEVLCKASETELNRIKPFIRQLVDEVEPIKDDTTT